MVAILARVETPLGEINVLNNPDPDHPGVWVELPGEGDKQLVLVEYSPEGHGFAIQVWNANNPSDDPEYIQNVTVEGQ